MALRSVGALLVGCALSACGSAEPSQHARSTPRASPRAHRTVVSGNETREETTLDALAAGRALVVPGPQGFVSSWRVLGSGDAPLSRDQESALGAPCEDTACEPLVAFDEAQMALARIAQGRRIYLGTTLLAPRETRLSVLVGTRGPARMWLDGERVASADEPDRFLHDLLVATMTLSPGEHRLVLRFDKPLHGRWRAAVRMLDARVSPGSGGVGITLGRISEARAAELANDSVRVDEHHELVNDVARIRLRAHLPGGGVQRAVDVRLGDRRATLAPESGLSTGELELVLPMPARDPPRIDASVGARVIVLFEGLVSDRRVLQSAASLRRALPSAPENARAPIAWRIGELERIVRDHDDDQAWRTKLQEDALRITRSLARGRDPFARIHGYERMAFFSRLDGTAQEYELFVPPAYQPREATRWPLVVTLHGLSGNAGDYFRNTFGLTRNPRRYRTTRSHGRHGPAPTEGPMFVIAPTGRGQAFYRHAGEIDVLEAIEDVRRRFPEIDEERMYITGGSMGGTGAAYLPYRHPDLFAASAALAGYHDQRIRADTRHEGLSPVEHFLQAHRSDVDWAENGAHLPMLLVRGMRDRPLEWTRCLARRLNQLGYACEHREPEAGHNVWNRTYADGAIFDWFAQYRRPSHPTRVVLRTARERTRRAYWVTVQERTAPDVFADIEAEIHEGEITAHIEGAKAVTFDPGPPLVEPGAPIGVRIGATRIEGPSPLTIERTRTGWQRAVQSYPAPGARRPGLDGPIREVFHEPLTFVVGTQDPDHTFINRLVAEHWARPPGWIISYPIVDDDDVTEAMTQSTVLVLVGPPSSNSVLARIADRLPIRIGDSIRVGDVTHRGENVGTVFVAPNPLSPERLVLVIAGPTPLGTFRSIQLPDILPDYVVFDERVAPARDRWACGGTGCGYRAHGFFDMHWRLP